MTPHIWEAGRRIRRPNASIEYYENAKGTSDRGRSRREGARNDHLFESARAESCLTTRTRIFVSAGLVVTASAHGHTRTPWRRAAESVFSKRQAIVIGPVPPGIGVIADAMA